MLKLAVLACILHTVSTFADRDLRRHDVAFVHTFDTREMCMARCRTTCTQQHSEDLMMPRWQCPLQDEPQSETEEEEEWTIGGKLLLIIPLGIFGSLLFLFLCVSATQRFCRSDY